jgi:hypothetical protein
LWITLWILFDRAMRAIVFKALARFAIGTCASRKENPVAGKGTATL